MRRILSGFLRVKRTRHERKSDAACGLRVARQRGKPKAAAGSSQVFPIPSILKAIDQGRPGGALHLSPLSNGRKRMQETLLDFDTADASGDRGAIAQQNLKARGWKLRPKKVSQRAPKPLKVFAHVNLCARLGLGADLALGLRILALASRSGRLSGSRPDLTIDGLK